MREREVVEADLKFIPGSVRSAKDKDRYVPCVTVRGSRSRDVRVLIGSAGLEPSRSKATTSARNWMNRLGTDEFVEKWRERWVD